MIANRYELLEPFRSGVPLRARDHQTAQTVVLREAGPVSEERALIMLQRARAAKGIFHPSLITLFDVCRLGVDRLLLAYEYVPAQSIRQIGGGQPFNPRRAAELLSEIADAVAELHARQVIHGAISAETVLLTMKGKAKLDRIADPMLETTARMTESGDVKAIIALLGELTRGAKGTVAAIDAILDSTNGIQGTSASVLAATLRAAARRD
jgi:serine/threonine protein kinase